MKTKRGWTPAEEATLRELSLTTTRTALAKILRRSPNAIACKAVVLGVAHPVKPAGVRSPRKPCRLVSTVKVAAFLAETAHLFDGPRGGAHGDVVAHLVGWGRNKICASLSQSVTDGRLFVIGKHVWSRYFLTAEAAETGAALIEKDRGAAQAVAKAKKRARERAAWAKAHPAGSRVVSARVATVRAPKAPTSAVLRKSASATTVSQADKPRGIAHLPGEADYSRAVVTRAPTPPGRYAVPAEFRGAFSLAGVGRDVETGKGWGA